MYASSCQIDMNRKDTKGETRGRKTETGGRLIKS